MRNNGKPSTRAGAAAAIAVAAALLGALLLATEGSARSAVCGLCGKNLIKNPGAEGGRGQNAAGETGNVPGWTNTAGAFGAAAYTGFGVGWFNATSTGPKNRGKNYFFGGTSTAATSVHATIGTQTIKLPAAAPNTIRARTRSGYGVRVERARRDSTRRSGSVNTMTNGLETGM